MAKPYDRVTWRGHTFNLRTIAMIEAAEQHLGFALTVVQGSYHTGTAASAGTHDGGGAVDVQPTNNPMEVQAALRRVGFAAWYRPTIAGVWEAHVHAIAIGDKQLAPMASAQVTDYGNHLNGLASHAPDTTWRPDPIPVFDWSTRNGASQQEEDELTPEDKDWLKAQFDDVQKRLHATRVGQNKALSQKFAALKLQVSKLPKGATNDQVKKLLESLEVDFTVGDDSA